jgi:hypothetical protein
MNILLMDVSETPDFLEKYSSSITILLLTFMGLGALVFLVPRLLQTRRETQERLHHERMKALENGQTPPHIDERSVAAGRTAFLVPMVVICAAGAVTCFMAAYRPDNLFSVALAAWSVAGVVSLAAIMGGVALMGRLAQLQTGLGEEEEEEGEHRHEEESASGRGAG